MELVRETRDLVISKVKELFPLEDPDAILEILDRYGLETYERERDRVQCAVLWLSKGEMGRLLKYIDTAKGDYRDVLLYSQYLSKEAQVRYHAWLRGDIRMDET